MNVLFISCNYPGVSTLFCQRLANQGGIILGIGDVPETQLPAHLREALRAYRHVPDMNDTAAMKRTARELQNNFGRIDKVDSNIEHWLTTESAIRADLHIAGMQTDYLTYARSKIGMKKLFADAGVPLMAGINTTDKQRVREFAQFHGFPLFFKPDTGVGALGAFKVETMADLEDRLPDLPPSYIGEPFIKGRIVTFDGLADANGEIFYHTGHTYKAVAEMIRDNGDVRVMSFRELPTGLEELGRRTVKSFDVRERFFHIEFFETSPGEYVALEMNLRAPGSTVLHLMNYGADIDVFSAWARLVLHGDNKLDYRRRYHAAHIGRRDHIQYKHPHAAVLDRLGPALVHHVHLPTEDVAALGNQAYIIRHESHEEMEALVHYIEARG